MSAAPGAETAPGATGDHPACAAANLRSAADQAARRHLEDRERLLFTSRSVSVSEMAATLAHELNQPLGSVANVLRGVLARLATVRQQTPPQTDDAFIDHLQQGVQLALEQALYAARVVGRVREFTRARQPQWEPVDLHALVRESLAMMDWEISRRQVQVVTHADRPGAVPSRVMGDATMLQQVLVNLLRNALDAMRQRPPGHGRLQIAMTQTGTARGGEVEIAIADNGSGLSQDAEAQLFVPFHSTKPNGLGIGLNICRSFVELHQGRLWFSRPQAGASGCVFHVALPVAPQESNTTNRR